MPWGHPLHMQRTHPAWLVSRHFGTSEWFFESKELFRFNKALKKAKVAYLEVYVLFVCLHP